MASILTDHLQDIVISDLYGTDTRTVIMRFGDLAVYNPDMPYTTSNLNLSFDAPASRRDEIIAMLRRTADALEHPPAADMCRGAHHTIACYTGHEPGECPIHREEENGRT